MNIFVGIDPSINSTGVCILETDDNNKQVNCKFYIIKNNKLTKKESKAGDDNAKMFQYVLYDKLDTSIKKCIKFSLKKIVVVLPKKNETKSAEYFNKEDISSVLSKLFFSDEIRKSDNWKNVNEIEHIIVENKPEIIQKLFDEETIQSSDLSILLLGLSPEAREIILNNIPKYAASNIAEDMYYMQGHVKAKEVVDIANKFIKRVNKYEQ